VRKVSGGMLRRVGLQAILEIFGTRSAGAAAASGDGNSGDRS